MNYISRQLALIGTGYADSIIIFRQLIELQEIVGRLIQLYAEQAASNEVFTNVVLARIQNHNAILDILQLIAGEIVIPAVHQEYALWAIEEFIFDEIVLRRRVEIYTVNDGFSEDVLCERIVVRSLQENADIPFAHHIPGEQILFADPRDHYAFGVLTDGVVSNDIPARIPKLYPLIKILFYQILSEVVLDRLFKVYPAACRNIAKAVPQDEVII